MLYCDPIVSVQSHTLEDDQTLNTHSPLTISQNFLLQAH
jgi:hypothetical protein